jgi:16S rRNA (adenine1518-N6/adenine1519-N6)-dimethyltransferase
MVRAAEVDSNDTVLEIGPGLGVLTRPLVRDAGRVVSIELDRSLAEGLPGAVGTPANLTVIHGDALSTDLRELVTEPYKVVASLPYHVASPILFKLVFEPPTPARIVVMLQLEVAERLAPRDGAHTFLGTAFSLVAEANLVRKVAAGSFFPAPKVQSAIVRFDLRPTPVVPVGDVRGLVDFVRAGFAQPRKQLHNSLARGLGIEASAAQVLILEAGVRPMARPSELELTDWTGLYGAWRRATA